MLWEYQIWLEMWLGGMAGGAFLTAFLYELFSGQQNKQLLRPATFIGIPLVIVALILALLDLGMPERFWHMMVVISPLSPIWIGAILLSTFVGISIVMAILFIVTNRRGESKGIQGLINLLGWVNAIVAAVLIAYSGVMLAASNVPLWASTPLMPPLFVASAVATGVAILIFSALIYRGAWQVPADTLQRLANSLPVVVIIQLLLLGGLVAMAGSSSSVLTSGAMLIPFIADVLVLILGVVLIFMARSKLDQGAMRSAAILGSLLIIVGGLLMRAVIIIGGQS